MFETFTFLDWFNFLFWLAVFVVIIWKFVASVRLVPTQKAAIVERLGKYYKTLDAGFHALIPFVDKVVAEQDLREFTIDVPPQECFSVDEVNVIVDGVIYLSVVDPAKASYGVTDYVFASIELAQTTTRSIIGKLDLDRTFEERDLISSKVVEQLNLAGANWGIRVHRYEIKNITPPSTVQNAMEKQVGAERQRRAILAKSEGDKQARINMSEGKKTEMINLSEGQMQKMVNEAQGHAEEIIMIAKATADSIRKVASTLTLSGGEAAVRLKLSEKYLKKIRNLADAHTEVIMPGKLQNFDDWMRNIGFGEK
jgi:regulator of protease activity HflC (stomatin/prohibitin superfamily)